MGPTLYRNASSSYEFPIRVLKQQSLKLLGTKGTGQSLIQLKITTKRTRMYNHHSMKVKIM